MCRGFQHNERQVLKIKAFYVRLLFSTQQQASRDSLTLHFPPRINGGPLEINGLNLRPDTPAFVTLHPVISADTKPTRAAMSYGSRERVTAGEGLRFEIYASNAKVLKGTVRKDEEGENWKLDCESQGEEEEELLSEVDVCVEAEGRLAVMSQKVEIAGGGDKTKRRRRSKCFQRSLEEIPEQREESDDSDGCCSCCCGDGDIRADGKLVDGGGDHCKTGEEVEMDGVRWAVDVGIWVVCLGVGFLVSKASGTGIIRQRRRRRLFYF